MEYFDIVDENGIPTGEVVERAEAHIKGIPHRTSHVWIMRKRENGYEILLQKRCMSKDSFPGCYDISSAGHVPQGVDFLESALRELKEELDVEVAPEDMNDLGIINIKSDAVFHSIEYHDVQVARVYLLWIDEDESYFKCQEEEIDEVRWMDFEECKRVVKENRIPNCIILDELKMLEEHIG